MHHPSPRDKIATPPNRSPSELRRMEDVRPTSGYHPSEAAHHPPSLPSMQSITAQSPQPQHQMSAPPQEDNRSAPMQSQPQQQSQPPQVYEPAARKMDVDENYDDSADDKSTTKQESRRNSPKPINGGGSAPVAVEGQA
ncbi:hypothetical protein KC343_g18413 [Hortaea werneckii]|nr:hypothetical protein KC343_g18413 [Hortaea werneckii]